MKNLVITLINSGVVRGFAYVDGCNYVSVACEEKLVGNARSARPEAETSADWMIRNLPCDMLCCEFVIHFT